MAVPMYKYIITNQESKPYDAHDKSGQSCTLRGGTPVGGIFFHCRKEKKVYMLNKYTIYTQGLI